MTASYTWWNYRDYGWSHDVTRYGGSVYVGRRLKWPDDYFMRKRELAGTEMSRVKIWRAALCAIPEMRPRLILL